MTNIQVKAFEEPKMDFIRFDAEDIITTSDGATIVLPEVEL